MVIKILEGVSEKPMSKQWLTVEQVAEILQIKATTVRSYINLKEHPLPAVPLGKRGGYRIEQADLDKWMEERKTGREK